MKAAFLFPGQGSQQPGMGRELAAAFPAAREAFAQADAALGESISALCFEGDEASLALTENTQPAILATSVAALRAFGPRAPAPVAAAGHSLGEYAAHVAAGTIDFADAVRTVRRRGRFMQEAVPVGVGAMAAILGLEAEQVARLCAEAAAGEVVAPANLNGGGQIVIAGHAGAVARAVEAARSAGARRAVPLPVSAPFHCALMLPAAERLEPVLAAIAWREPVFPVYTNVDGVAVRDGAAARDALVRQVASPVRWDALVRAMAADGVDTFVELGPGKVLTGLVRRIVPEARALAVSDPETLERAAAELAT